MGIIKIIFKQLFNPPSTNLFPVKYAPDSILDALELVGREELTLVDPVPVPPNFRGKIVYDRDACIGCRQCLKVCPSDTIEFLEEDKKVRFLMARCTFCEMCADICPKKCISMSDEFLMATTNKFDANMIVSDNK